MSVYLDSITTDRIWVIFGIRVFTNLLRTFQSYLTSDNKQDDFLSLSTLITNTHVQNIILTFLKYFGIKLMLYQQRSSHGLYKIRAHVSFIIYLLAEMMSNFKLRVQSWLCYFVQRIYPYFVNLYTFGSSVTHIL